MKQQSRIHQFLAFCLLLTFTVQAGLGLWLHRIFHQPSSSTPTQVTSKSTPLVVLPDTSINCSCVDDFLVPFTEAVRIAIPKAYTSFFVQEATAYYEYIPHSLRIFRSLRAPPIVS
jgi:hypothetical protein